MASPPEAPPSAAPSAEQVVDESVVVRPLDQAKIWRRAKDAWGSLRWRTGLLVVGSLLGCQAMAASRPITASVALVMPQGLDGARDAFLQGLALGEEAIQACGAEPASMVMHSLPADADPLVLFPRDATIGLWFLPWWWLRLGLIYAATAVWLPREIRGCCWGINGVPL